MLENNSKWVFSKQEVGDLEFLMAEWRMELVEIRELLAGSPSTDPAFIEATARLDKLTGEAS